MRSDSDKQLVGLAPATWRAQKAAHLTRVREWTTARTARAGRAISHPVYDFLFEYYSFRPAHLERWSPGADVILEECSRSELDWPDDALATETGWTIPSSSFPSHRHRFIDWGIRYLSGIAERPPLYSCFGLHEWAMVYKSDQPRHSKVPLRLSSQEISQVVESAGLRCTHYDAFRFFTPEAVPLNKAPLTRETTSDFDQRACIHVTMDLYKFAHKISPWCPSDLVADAFLLAADARSIDMRASPYDLRNLGFEPIQIETPRGREEYVKEQRRLSDLATPIRTRLLEVYRSLLVIRA